MEENKTKKTGILASAMAFAMTAMGDLRIGDGIAGDEIKPRHPEPLKLPTLDYAPYRRRGLRKPQTFKPVIIRNPKIAAHVKAMHEKWQASFVERPKMEADPHSITTLKFKYGVQRHMARLMAAGIKKNQQQA